MLIVCLISTNLIFNKIYAEIFEFNEKDYYTSSDSDSLNSGEKQTNSEDTSMEDDYSSGNEPTNSGEKQTNSEDTVKKNLIEKAIL